MKCDRCGSETNIHTTSWFNEQRICPVCRKEELAHPQINEAKRIENEHVLKGERNFKGVGLPQDLQEKYNCGAF